MHDLKVTNDSGDAMTADKLSTLQNLQTKYFCSFFENFIIWRLYRHVARS